MMRVAGLPVPAYPLDRSARPGSAPAVYRDTQAQTERWREAESGATRNDTPRPAPEPRRSEADAFSLEVYRPIRFEAQPERPVSSRAATALASYAVTASFPIDPDAAEVLGLDLYA